MKNKVSLPTYNNVTINVIDRATGKIVQSHTGHNECTNSLLVGVAHYLTGDGVLNQGYDNSVLSAYVPKYISLGTMGLLSQEADENGLPKYIGDTNNEWHFTPDNYPTDNETLGKLYDDYVAKRPGFGADGYDSVLNNGRDYFGLGQIYTTIGDVSTAVDFEVISPNFSRAKISHREIVAETQAEQSKTVDVVFSAMVSVGALAQFRGDNDYIYITECGLWGNTPNWKTQVETVTVGSQTYQQSYYVVDNFWDNKGYNSLLAGYRMVPPSTANRYFTKKSVKKAGLVSPYTDDTMTELKTIAEIDAEAQTIATNNLAMLPKSILRVGPNQVVQVVWKVQLGDVAQFELAAGSVNQDYADEYAEESVEAALNVNSTDIIIQGGGN